MSDPDLLPAEGRAVNAVVGGEGGVADVNRPTGGHKHVAAQGRLHHSALQHAALPAGVKIKYELTCV